MENERFLLASDMDGTVVPLDDEPGRQRDVDAFRQAVEGAPNLLLAYVTGRHLELALEGVARHGLPRPDRFVCDVGTSVYEMRDGAWRANDAYRADMQACFGGHAGGDVVAALQGDPDIAPQADAQQAEFKRSYFFEAGLDPQALARRLGERLADAGIEADRKSVV